jgi:hypothetical protein
MNSITKKEFEEFEKTLNKFYKLNTDSDDEKKIMNNQLMIFEKVLHQITEFYIENNEDDENDEKVILVPNVKKPPLNRYNRYIKEKMTELKITDPELTTKERYNKVSGMWKDNRTTWEG